MNKVTLQLPFSRGERSRSHAMFRGGLHPAGQSARRHLSPQWCRGGFSADHAPRTPQTRSAVARKRGRPAGPRAQTAGPVCAFNARRTDLHRRGWRPLLKRWQPPVIAGRGRGPWGCRFLWGRFGGASLRSSRRGLPPSERSGCNWCAGRRRCPRLPTAGQTEAGVRLRTKIRDRVQPDTRSPPRARARGWRRIQVGRCWRRVGWWFSFSWSGCGRPHEDEWSIQASLMTAWPSPAPGTWRPGLLASVPHGLWRFHRGVFSLRGPPSGAAPPATWEPDVAVARCHLADDSAAPPCADLADEPMSTATDDIRWHVWT